MKQKPVAWQDYTAASEAFHRGHLSKASRILRQALQNGNSEEQVEPLLVKSAQSLAEKYYADGDYLSAAALYRVVLEVNRKHFGETHPQVSECQRRLESSLWESGSLAPASCQSQQ